MKETNDGKKGGLLKGKPHYDKDGKPLGGIKAVVTDAGGRPVELEGGEVIINKEASKKHWKLLSKINQSAGNGVAIGPPSGAENSDEDPEEFAEGGKIIEFNPNHVPNRWIVQYAEKIKKEHPEIWKLGGNIFGNEAFENLLRVSKRGHWLDSEEWMYKKWRSYVARHIHDYRIEGVVAMLKWCDKVEKGWAYMKDLIEEKIEKIEEKEKPAKSKMAKGGEVNYVTKKEIENLLLKSGIELKYDYSWSREDNLNFHQHKTKAVKAKAILNKNKIKTGTVNFLFGDNYLKIFHLKEEFDKGGGVEKEKDKRWLGWFVLTQNFRGDLVRWMKGELVKAEKSEEKGYVFIQAADVTVDAYDNIQDVDFNRLAVPLNPTIHKRQTNYLKKIDKLGYVKPWEAYSTSESKKMAKGGGVDSIEPEGYKKEDAIKYGKKLVDSNLKYIEIRNKIEENYAGLKSEIQEVLNSVLDYYDKKKSIKQSLSQGNKTSSDRINKFSATLLNELKRYAKENYNEDVLEDTFMLKGSEKDGDFQAEEVSIDTTSGRDIHITINELFMKRGGELAKGIRAEMEHKKTIDKIYNRKVSKSKAPELIAKDHLEEDPKYYSKLEKIEGKKFGAGSSIESFDIGDKVYLNTKKGKIEAIITKYSKKWVQFDDLTNGKKGKWKATPEFNEEFDSFVDKSSTTTTPSTPSITQTTNGFKVGDIVAWKENIKTYNAKKGDLAKIVNIATEGEEFDIEVEWISNIDQKNGWYLSNMFELSNFHNQTQQTQEPVKKPTQKATKKQTKVVEPEPPKRKFVEGKDYLKIFTEYIEKDNRTVTKVTEEMIQRVIVDDFIKATKDISGFDEKKLKQINSHFEKQ